MRENRPIDSTKRNRKISQGDFQSLYGHGLNIHKESRHFGRKAFSGDKSITLTFFHSTESTVCVIDTIESVSFLRG
jgi:hypothetical protein